MDYNTCYYRVNGKDFELQHHGVKGMKWGVRRYQNKDGSLTPAGKKRYGDSPEGQARAEKAAKTRRTAARVATALVMTASVAVAVSAYKKNPEAIRSVLSKVGNSTINGFKTARSKAYAAGEQYIKAAREGLKAAPKKAAAAGKQYAKDAYKGFKDGVKAGFETAPKKAAEAIVTGATMMVAKRILDAAVGKEEAARIFQANNKKKIGSFWKVSPDDKDDD